ncbi:MAG: S41 family peptidase [Gemmatimonadota bacterium]
MRRSTLTLVVLLLAVASLPAQDLPVDAAGRALIIDGVARKLADGYVFADRAAIIQRQLASKSVRARYDSLNTASALTQALTHDLQQWSQDRHLRVIFGVRPRPMPNTAAATAESRARDLESGQARNFGFHQVERLTGNVGYLEIGRFDPAALAAPTAVAAMQFLSHTDALIIDLRANGGGRADMVAFMTSYFVDEPTKLITLERRDRNASDQIWSLPYVPGQRYTGKPVFVLTSNRTFSGAEALTYDLRHFAHAIVIGEKTRGGANPGEFRQINEHYAVFVPTARVVHGATGTNWGTDGITPDVAVAAADGKHTAHRLALQKLLADKADSGRAAMWKEAMDELFATTSQPK